MPLVAPPTASADDYRFDIDESDGAMFIEAMRPVPQRLPIHAVNPGRRRPIHPIVDRSQRQQPPRLIRVLRLPGQTAKICRRKIIPKTNRCAHLLLPESNREAQMNHNPPKTTRVSPYAAWYNFANLSRNFAVVHQEERRWLETLAYQCRELDIKRDHSGRFCRSHSSWSG
jgi:hypothetical protein